MIFRLKYLVQPNSAKKKLLKVTKYPFSLTEIPVSNFYPVKIAFFGAALL